MQIDPYILAFSFVTVAITVWMGFRSAKSSKTASDFFVAGRSVGVGMNASAISGEYLSAASFMGIAGMVMSSGYDALWYPVCYACGYLFLLLFIAGPLRRFGAYTIPDFAEGRFDSPLFRKIAVVFVLFIGFFYTMPQMKGAGTTLGYIFQDLDFRGTSFEFLAPMGAKGMAAKGLNYAVGVFVVGAVITLNVALGGMKGITLVQAFQYWAKMFAISVPIFVLMAVYGHYGKQVGMNNRPLGKALTLMNWREAANAQQIQFATNGQPRLVELLRMHARKGDRLLFVESSITNTWLRPVAAASLTNDGPLNSVESDLEREGIRILHASGENIAVPGSRFEELKSAYEMAGLAGLTNTEIPNRFKFFYTGLVHPQSPVASIPQRSLFTRVKEWLSPASVNLTVSLLSGGQLGEYIGAYGKATKMPVWTDPNVYGKNLGEDRNGNLNIALTNLSPRGLINQLNGEFAKRQIAVIQIDEGTLLVPSVKESFYRSVYLREGMYPFATAEASGRAPLPEKAPADATWLNPFGPLTTKAARNAAPVLSVKEAASLHAEFDAKAGNTIPSASAIALRAGLSPDQRMTVNLDSPTVAQALGVYAELTGRQLLPNTNSVVERVDELLGGKLSALKLVPRTPTPDNGVREHADGAFTAAEVKSAIEAQLLTNGLAIVPVGTKGLSVARASTAPRPAGFLEKAWLAKHEKPLALLYTYSLIIAIVCGTAGLPHILVRFYTNPDGVAAKKTTMWVMILIGVFYVFPPVFGALGRNLLPDLYNGLGAKGTDKIVLELPRLLNEKYAPLGSILSGITCAGAFAAFMSTFSGLLVSMTGALAHDVYGRILRPQSTPAERMKMFKVGAVIIGGVAILLGMQVEQLQINFMVGQAFAIAAASYFPLLFMAVWWRNLTMIGAATGMLTGGISALACISLTSFSDLKWVDLGSFWAAHPLLRILCEQPAIWAVPLAIVLMIIVSKLTASTIPGDSRMKMLVLHAPEELGLKQEYIQEHQHGPGH